MDDQAWASGIGQLALAFEHGKDSDAKIKARAELYRRKLGHLSNEQWLRAVDRSLETGHFFPSIAELLKYGEASDKGTLEIEAAKAYETILDGYERGVRISGRDAETYGRAAIEAFVAAGGDRAFAWCEPSDQPFRRKRFIDAYVGAVEDQGSSRLPPGVDLPKALPRPERVEDPSPEQAITIVGRIKELQRQKGEI